MEKENRQIYRGYPVRLNHADIWDVVKNVATLGLYDKLSSHWGKTDRTAIDKTSFDAFSRGIVVMYESISPTVTVRLSGVADNMTYKREDFLKAIPQELVNWNSVPPKPTLNAYAWAKVQRAVIFEGKTPAQAEALFSNQIKFQPMEFGKMDWGTILKQAISTLGAVVIGGPIGLVGAVATSNAIQNKANAAKTEQILGNVKAASMQEKTEIAQAQLDAANATQSKGLFAGMLNFDNPTNIMILMVVGVLVLFMIFKPKKL